MKTKITLVCAVCAKTFEKEPWAIKDSTRYCSNDCRAAAQRKHQPRDLIESVDLYREKNPEASYNEAMKALQINPNLYYEARRMLGLDGVSSREGIKRTDAIVTKGPPKKVWDPVNLRFRGVGS